jgi:polysaccharide export outer membrane protein
MKVAGMTTDQVAQQLTNDLLPYLKKPIVNVRLLNFKISVMGDVLKPDSYTVQNEHINIYEALSLAGDLNITAKRKGVFLIREQNGKRQYFPIDLTKKEVFNQPYYYLQNNDILYVEPDQSKYSNVDNRGYKNTSLILSGLSAIAIVVSALLIQNR